MAKGQISHDLAGPGRHDRFVRPQSQSILNSSSGVPGVSEKNRAFTHGNFRRGLHPILASPRIDIAEENSMRLQNILVEKPPNEPQILERFGHARDEGAVFKMLDDIRVFFRERIPKISADFEIPEGVEAHSPASRR